MTEYRVDCDVTFGGSFYVEANSEEEAQEIIKNKQVVPSDIRNFYHINTQVIEIECEREEEEPHTKLK